MPASSIKPRSVRNPKSGGKAAEKAPARSPARSVSPAEGCEHSEKNGGDGEPTSNAAGEEVPQHSGRGEPSDNAEPNAESNAEPTNEAAAEPTDEAAAETEAAAEAAGNDEAGEEAAGEETGGEAAGNEEEAEEAHGGGEADRDGDDDEDYAAVEDPAARDIIAGLKQKLKAVELIAAQRETTIREMREDMAEAGRRTEAGGPSSAAAEAEGEGHGGGGEESPPPPSGEVDWKAKFEEARDAGRLAQAELFEAKKREAVATELKMHLDAAKKRCAELEAVDKRRRDESALVKSAGYMKQQVTEMQAKLTEQKHREKGLEDEKKSLESQLLRVRHEVKSKEKNPTVQRMMEIEVQNQLLMSMLQGSSPGGSKSKSGGKSPAPRKLPPLSSAPDAPPADKEESLSASAVEERNE